MISNRVHNQQRKVASILIAALFSIPCLAQANDRIEAERAKSIAFSLIEALVDNGVISREKADKLIADAESKAQAAMAVQADSEPVFKSRFAQAPTPAKVQNTAQNPAQLSANSGSVVPVVVSVMAPTPEQLAVPIVATIPQSNVPDVGADGKKVVHVAYIPEATKREMREQIKQEVLAQSKAERWGDPGALPDWLSRISMSGDFRVRNEYLKLNKSNTAAGLGFTDGIFTRAADIVGGANDGKQSPFNTQHDRDRWNIRARFNVNAKLTDMVSTGVSLSTGSTTVRTSTSQDLGQNFNKYSAVIDRAFIKLDPAPWFSMSAGRIANPFFSTDLVWADDLNFEGVAVTSKVHVTDSFKTFATAGWFPMRVDNPGTSTSRALAALQVGFDWALMPKTQFKLGTSLYNFRNIEGQSETVDRLNLPASDYGTRYEYPVGLRQMGNTLFFVNAQGDTGSTIWGLASKFRELNLTASFDFAQFEPFHIIFVSDYVKNLGYKNSDILARTGYSILDGKNSGFMEKIQIGAPIIKERGNWNVSLAYRKLGSDAVLDAFNNPDFGLGGTNNKGTIFTANYGIDKNTWITGRWLTSDLLESAVPQRAGLNQATKLNADMIQIELNARY